MAILPLSLRPPLLAPGVVVIRVPGEEVVEVAELEVSVGVIAGAVDVRVLVTGTPREPSEAVGVMVTV